MVQQLSRSSSAAVSDFGYDACDEPICLATNLPGLAPGRLAEPGAAEGAPLESLPYYENPFEGRNWEHHNLASPNALLDLRALQLHAELLYLAEYTKLNQTDAIAEARSKEIMKELSDIAGSPIYSD